MKIGGNGNRFTLKFKKFCQITRGQRTVCPLRFKKNFKNFRRDPHRIVSYGLQAENKDNLKSYIEGQIFEDFQKTFQKL